MQAIQLVEPEKFRTIEIPEASPPGPGEVLVRSHQCGICGTDISGYLGKMPFFEYPRIPGHELGVEVVAVGEGVTHVAVGDRCSVEPYMHCGDCYACGQGAINCCERLQVIGVMIDGGLRGEFIIRADKLHPSAKLSFEQLALVETLAIGCHAVDRGGVREGEACLVIGAGPIGLATLEFVQLRGARPVVLDLDEQRLAFCRDRLGIEHALAPNDDLVEQLKACCEGHLPDVVIDATGSEISMSKSFSLIAPKGRLVFVGLTTGEVVFRHPVFHRPEGTLLCSRNALPNDFRQIIRWIESGRIDTEPWITHRIPFAEVADQFPQIIRPAARTIKAMIQVS
ncbi:MAG: zinc-binding alcohol dehydrogenase family protein [Pirellulales bacterium]|nr:zinc-binding alcohol dehydrogenase family protein [Pirellulales bacterium]